MPCKYCGKAMICRNRQFGTVHETEWNCRCGGFVSISTYGGYEKSPSSHRLDAVVPLRDAGEA